MRPTPKQILSIISLLLAVIVIWGLIAPSGLRAVWANNLWSLRFIHQNSPIPDPPVTHAHAPLLLAHQALSQGDQKSALTYLAAIHLPNDPLAADTLAEVLFQQGKYPQAFQIWKDSGSVMQLEYAAHTLESQNNPAMAALAYDFAWQLQPQKYAVNAAYGRVVAINALRDSGQLDQAIAEYLALTLKFPEVARPWSELAQAYWLQNQPSLALNSITIALTLAPGDIHILLRAASMYEAAGFPQKALEVYQAALQVNPSDSTALQGVHRLSGQN